MSRESQGDRGRDRKTERITDRQTEIEGQDTEYRTVHRKKEMVTDRYREAERQIDRKRQGQRKRQRKRQGQRNTQKGIKTKREIEATVSRVLMTLRLLLFFFLNRLMHSI